jgi:transcription initiation factor TFIID TATA-box-binding protein
VTEVTIANIVGVLDFHRELDLKAVADLLESTDVVSEVNYSPAENHWLQTRFKIDGESKYVAFYRSGTCAIVGCNSIQKLNDLSERIIDSMSPVIRKNPTLEVKNLVCVGEINQNLNLERIAIEAGLEQMEYEPEQFPGLIYRAINSQAVYLIFASGKVVITGTSTIDGAEQLFRDLIGELSEWGILD